MKTSEAKNEINARSGNSYSNSEIRDAFHSVKSSGGDVNNLGSLEKAANDNRNYLSTPNDIPTGNGYTGYAYQESDY